MREARGIHRSDDDAMRWRIVRWQGPRTHAIFRMLDAIQRVAFGYFLHETNRVNGLVLDKTCADWPGCALPASPADGCRTILDTDEEHSP